MKDTATNLIWLQDWNVNGQHSRATEKAWAENLVFAGSSDWVLPRFTDYLTLFGPQGPQGLRRALTNLQSYPYWSSEEAGFYPNAAIGFSTENARSIPACKSDPLYAVAVRFARCGPPFAGAAASGAGDAGRGRGAAGDEEAAGADRGCATRGHKPLPSGLIRTAAWSMGDRRHPWWLHAPGGRTQAPQAMGGIAQMQTP